MENLFAPYECQFNNAERRNLIAKTIQELRKVKGYSQKEIAGILGIPAQTYNGYEKEKSDVPIEILIRLSFLYGVSMDVITQKNWFTKTVDETLKLIEENKKVLEEYKKLASEKDIEQGKAIDLLAITEKTLEAMSTLITNNPTVMEAITIKPTQEETEE